MQPSGLPFRVPSIVRPLDIAALAGDTSDAHVPMACIGARPKIAFSGVSRVTCALFHALIGTDRENGPMNEKVNPCRASRGSQFRMIDFRFKTIAWPWNGAAVPDCSIFAVRTGPATGFPPAYDGTPPHGGAPAAAHRCRCGSDLIAGFADGLRDGVSRRGGRAFSTEGR